MGSLTGWNFPPEFANNGKDVKLVSDETDIKQALEILFSTVINERVMRPDFGCNLKGFMFEEINNTLISQIENMIIDTIYEFEPRVKLKNVEISETANTSHQLLIEIHYFIIDTGEVDSMKLSLDMY